MQADDFLSSFVSSGYDGSAFQNPASIDIYVDGAPSPGNVPARISFVTGSNQANRKERLKVGNTGDFNFNNGQVFMQQSTGFVGIGTTSPGYQLNVISAYTAIYGRSANGVGVYGYSAYNVGDGLHGYANGISGYGLYSSSVNSYGLFAYTENTSSYAGYFSGKVFSAGGFTSSDKKLKLGITDVNNALELIGKLKPKYYTFRQDGDYKLMNLPQGLHYGLIAQDVEQILPNLVSETEFDAGRVAANVSKTQGGLENVTPIKPQAGGGENSQRIISFKALNYTELTPIIIKAMQEQQQLIEKQQLENDTQQKEIDDLKQAVKQLLQQPEVKANGNLVILDQNVPNPLTKATNIHYMLPAGSKSAQLVVRDIAGKLIKEIILGSAQVGNINFDASLLASGNYTYSIVVDGKLLQTKKMVVQNTLK